MKKVLILLIVAGLILFYLVYGNKLYCPIYTYLDIYCPACGISRMFKSILKLEFYQAFRYNPLLFILLPVTIVFFIVEMFLFINNKKIIKLNNNIYLLLISILFIYTILRNITFFSFLIPTMVN
jgi:uncharacterized protein (DUF983 family)